MATYAARRLLPMVENTSAIVAIELLAAAQGIDMRKPLVTSNPLRRAHALVRQCAAYWDRDRAFAPDLASVKSHVTRGDFTPFAPGATIA